MSVLSYVLCEVIHMVKEKENHISNIWFHTLYIVEG